MTTAKNYGTGLYGDGTFGGDAPDNTYGSLSYGSGTYGQPSGSQPDEVLKKGGWVLQQRRKRKFEEDRDEREELRRVIEQAVDPVSDEQPQVVSAGGSVEVVTKTKSIQIPVPPQFDVQAVTQMVLSVLEAAKSEARMAMDANARRQAVIEVDRGRKRKRRRDEEILLLM